MIEYILFAAKVAGVLVIAATGLTLMIVGAVVLYTILNGEK